MATHQEDGVLAYLTYTFTKSTSSPDFIKSIHICIDIYIYNQTTAFRPSQEVVLRIRTHRVFLYDDWTRLARSIYHQRIRAHLDGDASSFRGRILSRVILVLFILYIHIYLHIHVHIFKYGRCAENTHLRIRCWLLLITFEQLNIYISLKGVCFVTINLHSVNQKWRDFCSNRKPVLNQLLLREQQVVIEP